MSADKEKLDQLTQKVDELLAILKGVSEELKTTSASLKSLAVSQITSKPAAPAPSASSAPKPVTATPLHQPTLTKPVAASLTPKPTTQVPAPAASPSTQSVEDVRMMFLPELDSMLAFEDKGDYVMIKPKQFLGSENFAKIASTVRGIGGEYISAGRDSHFRVYKKH
jgi:predicted component of type VI protein secretion system